MTHAPHSMQDAGRFSSGNAFSRARRHELNATSPSAAVRAARYSLYAVSSAGISSCCGQSAQQYRHAVQGTATRCANARAALSISAQSATPHASWSEKVRTLSSTWLRSDMPESTTAIPGSVRRKWNAHHAYDLLGWASFSRAPTSSGRFASMLPCVGSITIMGMERSSKRLYCSRASPKN